MKKISMLILFILSCVIFAESAYGQINYPKSDGYKKYFIDNSDRIIKTYDFRNGNDVPYTMVFYASKRSKSECIRIYIVPYNFEYRRILLNVWEVLLFGQSEELEKPPMVVKLIYHNLGEDKEFCGVLVRMEYWGKQYEYLGYKEFEVRLPDEIANEIIGILIGESDIENMTGIKIIETDTPNLIPLRDAR